MWKRRPSRITHHTKGNTAACAYTTSTGKANRRDGQLLAILPVSYVWKSSTSIVLLYQVFSLIGMDTFAAYSYWYTISILLYHTSTQVASRTRESNLAFLDMKYITSTSQNVFMHVMPCYIESTTERDITTSTAVARTTRLLKHIHSKTRASSKGLLLYDTHEKVNRSPRRLGRGAKNNLFL